MKTEWEVNQFIISGNEYIIRVKPTTNAIDEDNKVYVVDVEAFNITGWDENNSPEYEEKNAMCGSDTTINIDKAKRILVGTIKWDGCSDINFYPDNDGCSHFCGMKSALDLGYILGALYEEAKKTMQITVSDLDMFNGV